MEVQAAFNVADSQYKFPKFIKFSIMRALNTILNIAEHICFRFHIPRNRPKRAMGVVETAIGLAIWFFRYPQNL